METRNQKYRSNFFFNVLIEEISKGCLTCSHTYSVIFLFPTFSTYYFRCWRLLLHLRTHSKTHTHTLGRTSLDKCSSRRRDLYLTTNNTQKNIHAAPGFEPTTRGSERPWTQALDHAASRMGFSVNITHILIIRVVDSRADKHHIECVC
jgi:hypothetical protein